MEKKTISGFTLLVWLVICTFFTSSAAAAGLDQEFADNGIAITDFGIGDDEAYDLAVQPDGKVVVAGYSFNGAVKNMAVARYLPDGSLDPEFNNQGFATFSLGTGDSVARAVELQGDGKIVLVGSTVDDDADIAVLRLTEDGYFDSPFGYGGHLLISMSGEEEGVGLEIGSDGSLFVAGSTQDGDTFSAIVAKLDPAGVLEESFGADGVTVITRDYSLQANALELLDDGRIVVVSTADQDSVSNPVVLRFNDDGTLDQDFGTEGSVELAFDGNGAELYDVLALADGGLATVGYIDNGSYREPLVVQLLADGTVNENFGQGGILHSDLGSDAVAYGVASLEDGSLTVTGYNLASTGRDIILLQTVTAEEASSANQELVSAESGDAAGESVSDESDEVSTTASYVTADIGHYDDESRAVSILDDGTIYTAGYTDNGTDSDFVLARYSDDVSDDGSREVSSSSEAVLTGNFYVKTFQPSNITRNSAATGGSISKRISDHNCDWYCNNVCSQSDDVTCYDTCFEECMPEELTVVSRGVAYGIVQYPVYRSDGDESDDSDSGDSTDENSFFDDESSESYEIVRSGQTSDGSGIGEYGSDIYDITPDTFYFARAYAVLSDDTVIYGNQVTFRTEDACFIATAAFGSLLDDHVVVLRQFRDRFMKSSELGKSLIAMYYSYSPTIADTVRESELLRAMVRVLLIPVVGLCYLLLHSYLPVLIGMVFISAVFVVPVFLLPRGVRYKNYESESHEKSSVEKSAEL